MSLFSDIRARVGSLFGRRRADRALAAELAFHVDQEAAKYRAAGLPPAEARRRAHVALGGVVSTTEATRDARGIRWIEDLFRDLRHGARQLRRTPGFAIAAILTIGLGIGATTAIFSVVDGVLLRRVPFTESNRLVVAWQTDRASGTSHEPSAWPDYLDVKARARTLAGVATLAATDGNLTPSDGEPTRVSAVAVTDDYFTLLGVDPILGRGFTAEEARPGGARVMLLSEAFWRRRYQADPGIIGRSLRLSEQEYTVVGVVPAGADFGLDQIHERADYSPNYLGLGQVDVWIPLTASADAFPRDTHPFLVLGRLAPGATLANARDEVSGIMADLERSYPSSNVARGANLETLDHVVFGPIRPILVLLVVAVTLVLLVASVNVANLLLARGAARTAEVAVRGALGAGLGRIGRQFLAEAVMLSLVGAVVGVGLAYVGIDALKALVPAGIPRVDQIGIDWRVLGATLGVSLVVGAGFGLVPTLQARRVDPVVAINTEGRSGSGGRSRTRFREALVVMELALSVALVVSAGLLARSLWRVLRVDAGFAIEGVVKAEFQLPDARYPMDFSRWPDLPEIQAFNTRVLEQARAIPGVTDAALAGAHPLARGFTNSFVIVGREEESRSWPELSLRIVSPSYFATMSVPLDHGRLLTEGDDPAAPRVALVNRAAADRYFGGQDPVGHEIRFWGRTHRIVGVVQNERFFGLTEPAPPATYVAMAQAPRQGGVLLVRTAGDVGVTGAALGAAIRAADPGLAVFGAEPLTATVARSISDRRFTAVLIGVFAAITILLALVGIHGVISYATAQRSREIGIRVALGATRGDVAGMVMRGGLRLAALGTGLGLAGAALGSALLARFLFGVGRFDPVTFVVVAGLMVTATAFATWLPANRAARAQPVEVLRGIG